MKLETRLGTNEYAFSLMFAKPDKLVFKEEKYRFSAKRIQGEASWTSCGGGHTEALLPTANNATAATILNLLGKLII